MKKLGIAIIVALLAASVALGALAGTYGYVWFSGNCNVRTGPGLGYSTLGSVASGRTLDYADDYSYDNRGVCWYKVYFNGSFGWVSSVYGVLSTNVVDDYDDDEMPLIVPSNSNGEWKNQNNDKLAMRIQVKNISWGRTVKAFEIHMYATDVWGDRIYGETTYYYDTTTKQVKPGEMVYSNYLYLPNRSRIDQVHAGIKRVICTDGTVYVNDTVPYFYWNIKH